MQDNLVIRVLVLCKQISYLFISVNEACVSTARFIWMGSAWYARFQRPGCRSMTD
jgi:hypothetical protein